MSRDFLGHQKKKLKMEPLEEDLAQDTEGDSPCTPDGRCTPTEQGFPSAHAAGTRDNATRASRPAEGRRPRATLSPKPEGALRPSSHSAFQRVGGSASSPREERETSPLNLKIASHSSPKPSIWRPIERDQPAKKTSRPFSVSSFLPHPPPLTVDTRDMFNPPPPPPLHLFPAVPAPLTGPAFAPSHQHLMAGVLPHVLPHYFDNPFLANHPGILQYPDPRLSMSSLWLNHLKSFREARLDLQGHRSPAATYLDAEAPLLQLPSYSKRPAPVRPSESRFHHKDKDISPPSYKQHFRQFSPEFSRRSRESRSKEEISPKSDEPHDDSVEIDVEGTPRSSRRPLSGVPGLSRDRRLKTTTTTRIIDDESETGSSDAEDISVEDSEDDEQMIEASPNSESDTYPSPTTNIPSLVGGRLSSPDDMYLTRSSSMDLHHPFARSPALSRPPFFSLGGGRRPRDPSKPPASKKYKCDLCHKAFSRSNTLVTHRRIHTGEKPFKCETCGRAFRQPGNLTRHRLTHTTIKPYVCNVCNKAFNRASNLQTHMRTHANYKPFLLGAGSMPHGAMDLHFDSYLRASGISLSSQR